MKVTPQITADLDEYPELRQLINVILRPVVDLMGVHAIASLRRMHKVGVFDHRYDKDALVTVDVPTLPHSMQVAQYTVGKAILDYLEAVGVSGVTLEMSQEEVRSLAQLWMPRGSCPVKPVVGEGADDTDAATRPAAKPDTEDAAAAEEAVPAEPETKDNKKE